MASGYRRHSTYRQATVAGAVTNTVFGFLRCYVLLAVAAGAGGVAAGYERDQLVSYVWFGQGLMAFILLWGWTELGDRIRTGDVVTDLLRPVHPVVSYLGQDLGRAAHDLMTRLLPPVVVGALAFGLYVPVRWWTAPLFAISAVLAVLLSFACRYLVNAVTFWTLDARGVNVAWALGSGVLCGLYFPLRFLPDWLAVTLWIATPFPGLLQTPLDVLVERDAPALGLGMVGLQVIWCVILYAACALVQRRAERRLVLQGG